MIARLILPSADAKWIGRVERMPGRTTSECWLGSRAGLPGVCGPAAEKASRTQIGDHSAGRVAGQPKITNPAVEKPGSPETGNRLAVRGDGHELPGYVLVKLPVEKQSTSCASDSATFRSSAPLQRRGKGGDPTRIRFWNHRPWVSFFRTGVTPTHELEWHITVGWAGFVARQVRPFLFAKTEDGALKTAEGRGTACNSASMQVALDI